jgi:hypothetical protein
VNKENFPNKTFVIYAVFKLPNKKNIPRWDGGY